MIYLVICDISFGSYQSAIITQCIIIILFNKMKMLNLIPVKWSINSILLNLIPIHNCTLKVYKHFITIVKAFLYKTDCVKHKRKRSKLHLSLNLAYHCIRQTLRIHVFLVFINNLCMLSIYAVILLFQ